MTSPADSWPQRLLLGLVLLVIPLSSSALALKYKEALGPYWYASNQDPDAVYLESGVALAECSAPGHTDHPGTLLHSLSAITLRVTHWISGEGTFRADVMARTQYYIDRINAVVLVIFFALLTYVGWAGQRLTRSILGGFLAQAGVLLCYWITLYLLRLRPEGLLACVSIGFSGLILHYLSNPAANWAKRLPLWLGLLLGLGMTAKITLLPVLGIPLFLFRTWKERIHFVLCIGLGFGIGVLPIVSRAPAALAWWWNLLTHKGMWASGERGLIETARLSGSMAIIYSHTKLFAYAVGLNLFSNLALIKFKAADGAPNSDALARRILWGILAAQVLGVLMIFKHPGEHYLIPVMSLIGLQACLMYLVWARPLSGLNWKKETVVCGVLMYALSFEGVYLIRAYKANALVADAEEEATLPAIRKDDVWIVHQHSSSVADAWYFGALYLPGRFSEELRAKYPRDIQLELNGTLAHFGKPVTNEQFDEMLKKQTVLLQIYNVPDAKMFPYSLVPILNTPYENLYRVDKPARIQ